jgi:hypothetical protein
MNIDQNLEVTILNNYELLQITGGVEPAEGSYAAGYAIGKWFNDMYHIWHYGLTHLNER